MTVPGKSNKRIMRAVNATRLSWELDTSWPPNLIARCTGARKRQAATHSHAAPHTISPKDQAEGLCKPPSKNSLPCSSAERRASLIPCTEESAFPLLPLNCELRLSCRL